LGSQQPALLLHSSGFQFLHQTEEAIFASGSVVVPDPIPKIGTVTAGYILFFYLFILHKQNNL
jgi:hypothetical protein